MNQHFSLSGWQRFLNYGYLTKYFDQSVFRGGVIRLKASTCGVIPIRCGHDLLNKTRFTQNQF